MIYDERKMTLNEGRRQKIPMNVTREEGIQFVVIGSLDLQEADDTDAELCM